MVEDTNLIRYRKRAYRFIKFRFGGVIWGDAERDDKIADTVKVKLSEIISLKEGKADPSAKLVEKIRELLKDDPDSTLAEEITHKLVEPFKHN